mmetsp:Transcript_135252/g.337441  ORF Transcript_135252/g.337441 Transcript_135252/m.337441 type:complete len:84 (-) Transcript_135252:1711-1962(-)
MPGDCAIESGDESFGVSSETRERRRMTIFAFWRKLRPVMDLLGEEKDEEVEPIVPNESPEPVRSGCWALGPQLLDEKEALSCI